MSNISEIKVNDILSFSKSYERDSYDYYKVIKVCSKTLKLRQLKTERKKCGLSENFYDWYEEYPTEEFQTNWANKYYEKQFKKTDLKSDMIGRKSSKFYVYAD
jgi:hypothetical protein